MAKRLTPSTASELAKIVERFKRGSKEVVHTYVNPRKQSSEPWTYDIDVLRLERGPESNELRIWLRDYFTVFHIGDESPNRHEDAVMFEAQGKELRITTTTPQAETSMHIYSFL